MEIKEVNNLDRRKWNDFVLENKGEFLQSWEWGNFQESFGRKIWRIGDVGDNEEILAVTLVIRHELPLGKNYLYCPRGPILKIPNSKASVFANTSADKQIPNGSTGSPSRAELRDKLQIPNSKTLELFLKKIKEISKKEKSVFLRWEPGKEAGIYLETRFPSGLGNLVSKWTASNIQPRSTLILDITKSEEQLLAEMKQKTRYNIKLAEKRGVKIRISDKNTFEADFEKFWQLAKETSGRDGFKIHPKEYYRKMLALQYPPAGGVGGLDKFESKDGNHSNRFTIKLFFAEYENKSLSANIVIFFGSRAVYIHGASSDENRNFMAPHLLQWEQIKNARETGCEEYDFWGISIKNQKPKTKDQNLDAVNYKSKWQGITKFKTGFGGKELTYPKAMDFVFQRELYHLIKFAKGLKKLL